jgi:2-methylcitrate dehydratase PrpD
MTASVTDRLTALVTRPSTMTDAWRDLGERAFVDTVAVLVAGADDPSVRIVAAMIDERDGAVVSLASGRRMSARSAALLDGTSAHALDYDDVDDALVSHPSAVLVPALLAAGQQHGATGEQLLRAYQVGLQAGRELGLALDIPTHYAAGWHSTSTVGTIAAAAGVANLLGLDATATRHALGIAGSLAGGSRQNFGTMTKPLHVGTAASNGVTAAQLASLGFTADTDQLDGPLGFLALHRGPGAPQHTATSSSIDEPLGLNVKLYACCYATHPAIEAATDLARDLPAGSEIAAIEVCTTPASIAPLIHHRPVDGTQAKFSMEYVVAAALLDGRVTFATFDQARVSHPDVQQLLRKVTITMSDVPSAPLAKPFDATVSLRLADGRTRAARVQDPAGHANRPLSEEQLRTKFDDCVAPADQAVVDAAYDALRHLRNQDSATDVAAAVGALRPEPTAPVA